MVDGYFDRITLICLLTNGFPLVFLRAFINQGSTFILNAVRVRCFGPKAHQDDAFVTTKAEVHSSLKVYSDSRTHLHVRENISGLKCP